MARGELHCLLRSTLEAIHNHLCSISQGGPIHCRYWEMGVTGGPLGGRLPASTRLAVFVRTLGRSPEFSGLETVRGGLGLISEAPPGPDFVFC